jgi:hypothetical protein
MFNSVKTFMLIEDVILYSINFSNPNSFHNKKILYYRNDTRNDNSGMVIWLRSDQVGPSPPFLSFDL